MSKPQNWLGALLALQVLLTAGLFIHHRQVEARQSQSAAVLSFNKETADKIVLTDDKGTQVTLSKTGSGWLLPDYKKLPVDSERVDRLLGSLSDLKGGWPVATTTDSYEQFQVADKKFARKVQVFSGDKPVAELLMGTSPGFRKTHVRAAKDSNVYAADINTLDVPVVNDQWLDRSLLKAKDPTEISGPGFHLKKSGADWTLDGPRAKDLNKANAGALAKALTGLRVESLQSTEPSGTAGLKLDVVDGGKSLTYSLWLDGQTATIHRSDVPESFTLNKATYDLLSSYTLAKLTEKPATPAPAATSP
jgi:hypothetical protein